MALPIRQNATHKVVLGPVVAVANGYVPVTTLSLSTADEAEVILHDNGTVVDISAYTMAAITTADGYYHLTLQSGITSTVGHMTVVINDDSLCLPVKADFQIVEEAVYDALYASGATGLLPANVTQWNSVALATTNPLPNAAAGAAGGLPTDSTGKTSFNDIAATAIVSDGTAITTSAGAVVTCTNNTDMRGTDSAFLASSAPTNFGDLTISLTTGLVSLSADQSGVTVGTVNTAAALGAQAKLDVNAEADAALADIHLDHLLAVDYDPASPPGTSTALLNELIESDVGVSRFTVNALENGPSGSGASAAAIADAVWDEVITGVEHNVLSSAARFLRESATATTGVTGTLQSATSTTAVLASGAVTADDYFNGERLSIIEGTGAGQSRLISDSTAVSDTVTLGHAWTTTPDATSIYAIMGAEADVRAIAEQPVTATALVDFDDLASTLLNSAQIGTAGAGLTDLGGMSTAMKAEVNSEAGAALTSFFTSPATLVDLIFEELVTSHVTSDTSLGGMINAIYSATTNDIQDLIQLETNNIDTALAAAKVEIDATNTIVDKIDTALEADGASGFQFTTLGLANAPSGTGGDATAANQTMLINMIKILARKDAGLATDLAAALAEINANEGSGAGAFSNITDSQEAIRDSVSGVGGAIGSGSTAHTITVTVGGSPVDGVACWVSTDIAGSNVVAGTLNTDAFGERLFMLDPGDYYLWRQLAGYNFTNPDSFTVV